MSHEKEDCLGCAVVDAFYERVLPLLNELDSEIASRLKGSVDADLVNMRFSAFIGLTEELLESGWTVNELLEVVTETASETEVITH